MNSRWSLSHRLALSHRRSRILLVFCALFVTLATAAGCTVWPAPSTDKTAGGVGIPIESSMPAAPQGLEAFYGQTIDWSTCRGNFQCADITVPLDYADPTGPTIKVAVLKRPAKSGKPMGSLFINPGGPGGSGIDLAMQAGYVLTEDLLTNFDVIGFDPRGVGSSAPIDCVDDSTLGRILDANYTGGNADAEAEADMHTIVAGCEANSGQLLTHVGTTSVARDLDILRDAVGDPKLYYLGMSYGTFIGEQYAEFFPDNVGRVVLDGVMNPTIGMSGLVGAQANGFETAIRRFMEYCVGTKSCPFTGTADQALAQLSDLFMAAANTPYPTDDPNRPLTQSMMFQGMILPLYSRANWTLLTNALTELVKSGTGNGLLDLNDMGISRESDGTFSDNSSEANWAVNCADYPSEPQHVWDVLAKRLDASGDVFGNFMATGNDMCDSWPGNPTATPGPFTDSGTAPIVLIGTVYDPATPYQWSRQMHRMMSNSVLLTYEGDGHTAYGQGVACIQKPVDDYLLNGTVPEDGLTCPGN